MQRSEQKKFVKDLSVSITKTILTSIDAGKVPADWNGIELRQLLADKYQANTVAMTRSQKREFNNTVLTANL